MSPLGSAPEVLYRGSLGPLHAWVGGEGLTGHSKAPFAKQAHCSFFNYYLFSFGCASSSLLGSVSRATLQLQWASFSLRWLLLWRSTGSVVVTHRPGCPTTWGIFLDQGSNLRPLRWQVGFKPLDYQVSPHFF